MPRLILLALLAATLTACKKQETASSSQTPTAEQQGTTGQEVAPTRAPAPVAAAPVTVTAAENGDVNTTLAQLSLELRKYVLSTKSAPKTFEEFSQKVQLQAPPPPAGKKYAIQKGAVVLVNR
jgi:ABC-type enterochelin transport system substrate-binding protein